MKQTYEQINDRIRSLAWNRLDGLVDIEVLTKIKKEISYKILNPIQSNIYNTISGNQK